MGILDEALEEAKKGQEQAGGKKGGQAQEGGANAQGGGKEKPRAMHDYSPDFEKSFGPKK